MDQLLAFGSIPVLQTLPIKVDAPPTDPKDREKGSRTDKLAWAFADSVLSYNQVIRNLARDKSIPCVDAWRITTTGASSARYFSGTGSIQRAGFDAVNERYLRLYRILERTVTKREVDIPARATANQ